MAKDEKHSVPARDLANDEKSYKAFKNIKAYNPANKEFTHTKGALVHKSLSDAQEAETAATKAYNDAVDKRIDAEWAFHNFMLGATDQVVAQFSNDSNEYESLGYKKKSDYKAPKRKPKPPTQPKA